MTLYKFQSLSNIGVSTDGKTMTVTLETMKGSKVSVEFASIDVRPLLQELSGALSFAESKSNLASQGVLAAMSPAQTRANRTEDGDAVIVSFRLPSSLQYDFALPSIDALQLGQKIVDEARKQTQSLPRKPH